MGNQKITFAALVFLNVLLLGCIFYVTRTTVAIRDGELSKAIELAVDYFHDNCGEDGRFVYINHTNPEAVIDADDYNLVRHAGTMYSLTMYCDRSRCKKTIKLLEKAASHLVSQIDTFSPVEGGMAVWTPGINDANPDVAKLGASALALTSLAGLEKHSPGSVSLDMLKGLGEFILFMQYPDGKFCSLYNEKTGKDEVWSCPYFAGEAILGLVNLYDVDPDQKWIEAASKGLQYIAVERSKEGKAPSDHWLFLASEALKNHGIPLSEDVINYTVLAMEHMRSDARKLIAGGSVSGFFLRNVPSCPLATRLEGVLAAITYLPSEHNGLKEELLHSSDIAMKILLSRQIKEGRLIGGIPRGSESVKSGRCVLVEDGSGEIRIDYVQHALSAMIRYEDLVKQLNPQ